MAFGTFGAFTFFGLAFLIFFERAVFGFLGVRIKWHIIPTAVKIIEEIDAKPPFILGNYPKTEIKFKCVAEE